MIMGQQAQKAWECTMIDDSLIKRVSPQSGNSLVKYVQNTRGEEETRFMLIISRQAN